MITKLLLVGLGKWGSNYISTINNIANVRLQVANRETWKSKIDDGADGVIVCTPPSSHIEIADYALSKGIPTMIEKPLALSYEDAYKLQKYNIPILVNHIHLFSSAYQFIKEEAGDSIQQIISFSGGDCIRNDYSPLWDYGSHDIAMSLDLIREEPQFITTKYNNAYNVKLIFSKSIADITINTKKQRIFLVRTHKDIYIYDDYNDIKLLKNEEVIKIDNIKPLTNSIMTFIKAIYGQDDKRLGVDLSLKVLKVLEYC